LVVVMLMALSLLQINKGKPAREQEKKKERTEVLTKDRT
jgi:hypothetical protein